SSSLELDEMLSATLDRLVALVGASRAGVMLPDGESGELEPRMLRPERPAEPDDLAEMTRACRAVIAGGKPLYAPPDPEKGFLEPGALLPLRVRGQALGVLVIIGPQGSAFSEEHLALFESIADQLGVAVENARLYEQAERAAIVAERNRLARELHDSVSQALYGIGLGARTARTLLDRQPIDEEMKARLASPLDYVLSLADAGLVEMRALIFELRLDALEKEGLAAALSKHAEALHARHKLDIHTEFCEEPELPLEAKEALYRIAQEALNNVVKHARAGKVEIRLTVIPGERIEDREGAVALEVQDDGVGFDPQDEHIGHMGLQSMRERATRWGGALEIESAPGCGTLLQARIPFSGASLGYARDRQGKPPTQTA
ncbi:MAG: GAF domain-containing sensor histidine kinase, partial [Chloroflexota bacterium]|nr:GAF domain-containing sensor histidine kinase [Chloroflexota bacterium]